MNAAQNTPTPAPNPSPGSAPGFLLALGALPQPSSEQPSNPEMEKVVPGGENHQGKHQGQADTETVFLGPLAEGFSADCLSGIEQQVATVKDRNRKQIDQAEIDRQHRHEPQHRDNAALRDL